MFYLSHYSDNISKLSLYLDECILSVIYLHCKYFVLRHFVTFYFIVILIIWNYSNLATCRLQWNFQKVLQNNSFHHIPNLIEIATKIFEILWIEEVLRWKCDSVYKVMYSYRSTCMYMYCHQKPPRSLLSCRSTSILIRVKI